MSQQKLPINRAEDGELLGYVVRDSVSWQAQTIFGYTFARSEDRMTIEQTVRDQGLLVLTGTWQYFDTDDKQWYPCIIKEASAHQVTVIRTNEMGYQDPDSYKFAIVKYPDETKLVKS